MAGLLVVAPPGSEAEALVGALGADGLEVHLAGSGAEGVSVALARQPEVVVLDPSLAALDRLHAAQRLASEPATSRIPVITLDLTPAGAPEGRSTASVLATIERTVGRRLLADGAPPAPPPATAVGPARVDVSAPESRVHLGKVLLAGGNRTLRVTWAERLSQRAFEVEVVDTGASVLQALERGGFDLVILDLDLPFRAGPGVGAPHPGLEVLARIRERHSPIGLPVLVTSAQPGPTAEVSALRAEANDFLVRPIDIDLLAARMRSQLALAASHRDLVARERRFRGIVEGTGDLVLLYRPDGEVVYASPSSQRLLGLEPAALVGQSLWDWLHPLDRRTLEGRGPVLPSDFTFVARLRTRAGPYVWVETSCRTLRQEGGPVVVAACRDVSEHMERIGTDEPPLPLGGDILAHPGWRTDATPGEAPRPVVLTFVVGEPTIPLDELSRHLSREIRRAMDPRAGQPATPFTDEGGSV